MTVPLLAYYGDDFTGSADVMEVLQWSGLRTVLFLHPPTKERLDAFDNLCAFGVAGWSRSMSVSEMDRELVPAFEALRDSGAAIVHYKTCSTFDSTPEIGSIGKALELGRVTLRTRVVPIVIGAPSLGRYQVFGNLFARSGLDTEPYRLDRHPTMRRHPITPMAEADLRVHLAGQTRLNIGLVDILRLGAAFQPDGVDAIQEDAVLFDVLYPEHLAQIGEAIQVLCERDRPGFVVGSSGVESALAAFWSQSGQLESMRSHPATRPAFSATKQLIVITGSCSPVNDRQITWAEQHGFESIPIDTAQLATEDTADREVARVVTLALSCVTKGASVILHSSRGPNDPRGVETTAALRSRGYSELDIKLRSGRTLGPKLGKILKSVLAEHGVARVAVAGGDTSGYIARELGITALEAIAPVAPGSPLCRAYADHALDGVEFFFKGGQVGKDDVWGTMLSGTA